MDSSPVLTWFWGEHTWNLTMCLGYGGLWWKSQSNLRKQCLPSGSQKAVPSFKGPMASPTRQIKGNTTYKAGTCSPHPVLSLYSHGAPFCPHDGHCGHRLSLTPSHRPGSSSVMPCLALAASPLGKHLPQFSLGPCCPLDLSEWLPPQRDLPWPPAPHQPPLISQAAQGFILITRLISAWYERRFFPSCLTHRWIISSVRAGNASPCLAVSLAPESSWPRVSSGSVSGNCTLYQRSTSVLFFSISCQRGCAHVLLIFFSLLMLVTVGFASQMFWILTCSNLSFMVSHSDDMNRKFFTSEL